MYIYISLDYSSHPVMTIVVDLGLKATKQIKLIYKIIVFMTLVINQGIIFVMLLNFSPITVKY